MTGPCNEDDLEEDQARDVSGNRESLDPFDMKESSIYRFLRKLERCYVVCLILQPSNSEVDTCFTYLIRIYVLFKVS